MTGPASKTKHPGETRKHTHELSCSNKCQIDN